MKGISLPTQRERCLEHAAKLGYDVENPRGIFVDGGESGRSLNRPALLDLLARAKEDKGVRAVIVYDLSRLARNRLDFALIKQELRKANIALVSATEPIDDSPEGQMLEGVLSTVAEFFSAQSARKVKANMRRKAESGGWPCYAPYGYRNRKEKLPTGEIHAWIEPSEAEAPWVKRVFALFVTGQYSVKTLARTIAREGFYVRQRKNNPKSRVVHYSHIERILRNGVYIGRVVWGDLVNERGTHEPIIEPELFHRVQDLLRCRSGSCIRRRRYSSPLKAVAICGECGSGMTVDVKPISSGRVIRYLRCRKMKKGRPVRCSQKYFAESLYATQVCAALKILELPIETVAQLKAKIKEIFAADTTINLQMRDEIVRQREALIKRRENLLVRSLDTDPNDETGRELFTRIESGLREDERRLDMEEARLQPRLEQAERTLSMALEIAGCCSRAFEAESDPDFQSLIVGSIFERLKMQDGVASSERLVSPIQFFRRSSGISSMNHHSDLSPCCAPSESLTEGRVTCRVRQVSKKEILRAVRSLSAEKLAVIETCYYELKSRGFLAHGDGEDLQSN